MQPKSAFSCCWSGRNATNQTAHILSVRSLWGFRNIFAMEANVKYIVHRFIYGVQYINEPIYSFSQIILFMFDCVLFHCLLCGFNKNKNKNKIQCELLDRFGRILYVSDCNGLKWWLLESNVYNCYSFSLLLYGFYFGSWLEYCVVVTPSSLIIRNELLKKEHTHTLTHKRID